MLTLYAVNTTRTCILLYLVSFALPGLAPQCIVKKAVKPRVGPEAVFLGVVFTGPYLLRLVYVNKPPPDRDPLSRQTSPESLSRAPQLIVCLVAPNLHLQNPQYAESCAAPNIIIVAPRGSHRTDTTESNWYCERRTVPVIETVPCLQHPAYAITRRPGLPLPTRLNSSFARAVIHSPAQPLRARPFETKMTRSYLRWVRDGSERVSKAMVPQSV